MAAAGLAADHDHVAVVDHVQPGRRGSDDAQLHAVAHIRVAEQLAGKELLAKRDTRLDGVAEAASTHEGRLRVGGNDVRAESRGGFRAIREPESVVYGC